MAKNKQENYKICPVCGTRNDAARFACKKCGAVFTQSSSSIGGTFAVQGSILDAITTKGKIPSFALFILFLVGTVIIYFGLGGVFDMFTPTGIQFSPAPFFIGLIIVLIGILLYYKAIKNIIKFRIKKQNQSEEYKKIEKESYEDLASKVEKAMKK